jgi:3alpha(or 20beta)-hydroxysteroid dehydrogenase
MGRLDGKVAIITGAARGQGAAEARLFAAEGAKVVVTDVLDAEGEALAKELGDAVAFVHQDVSQEADWERTVADAVERFGGVDVLVNNAAILGFNQLQRTTLEEYRKIIDVNQVGVFLGMRSVIKPMRARGGGSIINVSSVDGIKGSPYVIAYQASKFAVTGMTKGSAIELARYGIRVNSVHPGGVKTPMITDMGGGGMDDYFAANVPLGRAGEPEEIAPLVLFLASDESSYCTGAQFVADGGWTAGHAIPPQRGAR